MTNYAHGHEAEKIAAEYLTRSGYKIIDMNWRDRRAEIDIVAQKRPRFRATGPLVFFEVKYRKTALQGRGLEYITEKKLAQMRFAAELYVSHARYDGPYTLGAIELSGDDYAVTQVIESVIA